MNTNVILVVPDGYALPSGANSFTSNWFDKRSAQTCHLTVTLTGSNAPTGALIVQASDAPEQGGGSFGMPQVPQGSTSPVDVVTVAATSGTTTATSVSITTAGTIGLQVATSARWVRVKYTSSADVAGLTVNVYGNAPYNSPG
jgi:hypothetical protein